MYKHRSNIRISFLLYTRKQMDIELFPGPIGVQHKFERAGMDACIAFQPNLEVEESAEELHKKWEIARNHMRNLYHLAKAIKNAIGIDISQTQVKIEKRGRSDEEQMVIWYLNGIIEYGKGCR